MLRHITKKTLVCLVALLAPTLALADSAPQGPPSGRHMRPPQAAFDACSGKAAGESVEINTPRGTLKATCRSFDGELAAVPDGAPPGPPRGDRSSSGPPPDDSSSSSDAQ